MPKKLFNGFLIILGAVITLFNLFQVFSSIIGPISLIAMFLSSHRCNQDIIYQQPIDVAPLLEMEIPQDVDLMAWNDPEATMRSIGYDGVHTNIERHASIQDARAFFENECNDSFYRDLSSFTFGGEADNRYCASYVRESQAGPEGLCAPLGYHHSFIVFQKNDVTISIYERSSDETSVEKDNAIRRLVGELSGAANSEK